MATETQPLATGVTPATPTGDASPCAPGAGPRILFTTPQPSERNGASPGTSCIFFDRDGVLNENLGYVHRPEDFRWTRDAIPAVRWCNARGHLAIVVTNQSGIARGYYDEAAFHSLTHWMQTALRQDGAHLDGVYYCPHHPSIGDGPFTRDCLCRKPRGGMLRQAIQDYGIDASHSLLIGDTPSDMAAAADAGIPGFLYTGGSLLAFVMAAAAGQLAPSR